MAPVLSLFEDKSSIFFQAFKMSFQALAPILFLECAPAFPVTFSIQYSSLNEILSKFSHLYLHTQLYLDLFCQYFETGLNG